MTESSENPKTPLAGDGPTEDAAQSAGLLLRQAREQAGMHLGMLSVALKVPVRQLIALEADDHSQLSGPVFIRALASSVCRQLKIDGAPILALLPQTTHRLETLPPGLESTRARSVLPFLGPRWSVNRKFFLLALLMLVLIALIVWWPQWPIHGAVTDLLPTSQSSSEAVEPIPSTTASSSAMPLVVLLPSESSNLPAPGAEASTSKPLTSASGAVGANSALELTFIGKSDEAWVEVKDVTGALVFNKLVKSGETHVVKGAPALTVVVGLADAVEVLVRGQALDLTPFSRGAVARFEVK